MENAKLFNLNGRRALVTGSSRGIGRATALGLASQGADVCVHYVGSRDAAEEVANSIRLLGRKAAILHADLSTRDGAMGLIKRAEEGLGGGIDLLVINAAVQIKQDLIEIDGDAARTQFDTNVVSTISLVQQVLPSMKQAGFGRIVTIGSVQQWRPHPQMLVYAALKSSIENLVRSLAAQLGPFGITVNNVAPGAIGTDRNADTLSDNDYKQQVESGIPLQRIGQPIDCAGVVAMLCAPAGDYITGADIPVDGGMRLG